MTTPDCEHLYELDSIGESPYPKHRAATLRCTLCGDELVKHTTKTDEELAAELAGQAT